MITVHKFRSTATPTDLTRTLDIIQNARLYCAPWTALNDPMEGIFAYRYDSADGTDYAPMVEKLGLAKSELRVCSLSRAFDSHRMWAHYADGFRGLAIEMSLPEPGGTDIVAVQYRGIYHMIKIADVSNPSTTAREILSTKYEEWDYEKEVRVITASEYFLLPAGIKSVTVGHRMPSDVLNRIRDVCDKVEVPVGRVGIGDEGIDKDVIA